MPAVPMSSFPKDLPITAYVPELVSLIRTHPVVVVAGETGSGKSTQLAKIALAAGRKSIAHTQPRRLAARTIAERVAEELGEEVGATVGYQVRFTDRIGPDTSIAIMTDGILLNQIHRDRDLRRYDTIIIDEAHERSLTIDFLLGYLKRLISRRPDLRVIITSATIDPESFSKHFGGAPVVTVSGRTFPVEVRYRPLVPDRGDPSPSGEEPADEVDMTEGVCRAVAELCRERAGDMLVFVSGENDIRDVTQALEGWESSGRLPSDLTVLPLYGRLSNAEQHRVFERGGTSTGRRVIVATNIAETSLTVPGIRYVIDTGLARISRYSTRSKVQRLPIEPISQASARQRSGRCGRTSDGIAIRLYSEDDYRSRPEYTDPEILRTNLASVILQMAALRLGDIEDFPFLTPPDRRGVRDGVGLLEELGALDSHGRLTRIGRDLSRLPIEPRFGRMIVETRKVGCLREVLIIVAALTVQDPRERPAEKRELADQKHARFVDPTSDFLTYLNLWRHLEESREKLSGSAFRRMCREEFLSYMRVREWTDLYHQLASMARGLGLQQGAPSTDGDAIHRCLMAGLLSHLGVRDETSGRGRRAEYRGARGTRFALFPGSALAKRGPDVVMAAELVETSRLFARTVAAVDLSWAETLAADRVARNVSEPHWERKLGAVVGYERVTLYGLVLIDRRKVQFARYDRAYARELFIRHALVEGEWDSPQRFDRQNRELRTRLEQMEERTRRRDILRGDEAVFEFYDRRVPDDVVSTRSFEGWWRKARADDPDLLTMTEDDLVENADTGADRDEYPSEWHSEGQTLPLSYRFEPGAPDDGVTVVLPVSSLPTFDAGGFAGAVPGFRLELMTALIKSLPKNIRRRVVPAADTARQLLGEWDAQDGVPESLVSWMAERLTQRAQTPVAPADFDWEKVPPHLKPTFTVVDDRGRTIGMGKDIATLRRRFAIEAERAVAAAARKAVTRKAVTPTSTVEERTGITRWDLGDVPREFEVRGRNGAVVHAYPALSESAASHASAVDLRIFATATAQESAHRRGVRRLVYLSSPAPSSYVRAHLSAAEKLALASAPYPSLDAIIDDVLLAVAEDAVTSVSPDGLLWTTGDFDRAAERYGSGVVDAAFAGVATVAAVMRAAAEMESAIGAASGRCPRDVVDEVRRVAADLIGAGFVARTGVARLRRIPVYLHAAGVRVARAADDPARDRAAALDVDTAEREYREAGGTIPAPETQDARLTAVRWMLEELRVSAFAQQLHAEGPVSLQRVRKALKGIRGEGSR